MFPLGTMTTTDGEPLEVIDPGLHNHSDGPDFFNAKIRLGTQLWVGNVEIHLRASDWYRHHHETDAAYNNVVLHVVEMHDCAVQTAQQIASDTDQRVPTLVLKVPKEVEDNYRELLTEENYPPCYRVIPQLSQLMVHSWMSALTVERLETKTERIDQWLERTGGDWERTFFITLARAFGFGTNADVFEQWAATLQPRDLSKHRDSAFQMEAFFLGQAGFLDSEDSGKGECGTFITADYRQRLAQEYRFLQAKFGLTPLPRSRWKLRVRPQNAPQVRLSQLAELYHSYRLDFSRIREAKDIASLRLLLAARTAASPQKTETDGDTKSAPAYALSETSIDLLIINAVAPILFAYGRSHQDETLTERAFSLLEAIKPEHNTITRSWARAGITSQHAADSQALIQLRNRYCDRKDCLRCRFGGEYLRASRPALP